MIKTNWSKYQREILQLSEQGLGSRKIVKRLQEKYGDIFTKGADRRVRKVVSKYKDQPTVVAQEKMFNDSQKWDESKEGAVWEYNTAQQPITTLEDALHFCEVDLEKFEVERHIFNSWDVTMKEKQSDGTVLPVKSTNYQVKVWFKKIVPIKIVEPFTRPIEIKATKDVQMWIVIGCVHRPFHNKKLWDAFLGLLQHYSKNIYGIIINGDYLDLRSLSTHEEWRPEGIDLSTEYSDGLQGIAEIHQAAPDIKEKIFMYGNHEDRFLRDKKNIQKYGSALISPEEALRLDDYGYQVIKDWKDGFVKIGNDLEVFHGEYLALDAAKKHLQAMPEVSCMFNHTHRHQTFTQGQKTAYNIGWFGNVDDPVFKYMQRRTKYQWMNGFAVIYVDTDGTNHVTSIKCPDSKIFFEGKVFK